MKEAPNDTIVAILFLILAALEKSQGWSLVWTILAFTYMITSLFVEKRRPNAPKAEFTN